MSLRIQPRAYGPTACMRYRVLVLPFILPLHSHPLVAVVVVRSPFFGFWMICCCTARCIDVCTTCRTIRRRWRTARRRLFLHKYLSFTKWRHYFTQLNKYRGRRDSIDAFPLVRENSTSKEKEPMYVAFAFRAFALSLSLFSHASAPFLFTPNFVSMSWVLPADVPAGMSRLFFPNAADTVAKQTRARSQEKAIERKKSARVLPFFLSFFLVVARKSTGEKRSLCFFAFCDKY